MYFLLKMGIFQCHVSFWESTLLAFGRTLVSAKKVFGLWPLLHFGFLIVWAMKEKGPGWWLFRVYREFYYPVIVGIILYNKPFWGSLLNKQSKAGFFSWLESRFCFPDKYSLEVGSNRAMETGPNSKKCKIGIQIWFFPNRYVDLPGASSNSSAQFTPIATGHRYVYVCIYIFCNELLTGDTVWMELKTCSPQNYPLKMKHCPFLKGTIVKGNTSSEPTINFQGIITTIIP